MEGMDNRRPEEILRELIAIEIVHSHQTLYATILGYTNMVFTLSIGLYPTIIDSIEWDPWMKLPETTNNFNWILYLGSTLGVLVTIFTSVYKMPRKEVLYISVFTSLCGWILMFFARKYSLLLLARFIIGLSMGLHSVVFNYYLYECLFVDKIIMRNTATQSSLYEYFKNILLVLCIGLVIPWRCVIILGICYHLYALYHLFDIPESPYILLRNAEEEHASIAFYKLVAYYSSETRQYFQVIKNDVLDSLWMERRQTPINFVMLLTITIPLIFGELSGITVYYCYLTTIIENYRLLLIPFTYVFLLFGTEILSYLTLVRTTNLRFLLDQSSTLMGAWSFFMGFLFIMEYSFGKTLFLTLAKILVLQFYFLSYASGWLYSHHILFDYNASYYTKIRLVAPALLCKFLTAAILTSIFNLPFIGMSLWSLCCSVISITSAHFALF